MFKKINSISVIKYYRIGVIDVFIGRFECDFDFSFSFYCVSASPRENERLSHNRERIYLLRSPRTLRRAF